MQQQLFESGLVIDAIAKITGLSVQELSMMLQHNYLKSPSLIIGDKTILVTRIEEYTGISGLDKGTVESLNGLYDIFSKQVALPKKPVTTKQSIVDLLQPFTNFDLKGLNNLSKPTLLEIKKQLES